MTDESSLGYFIGAYFHEDYMVVHGSARGAVDDFVSEDSDEAVRVPDEISTLLALMPNDDDLYAQLKSYGLVYNPTMRDWPSHREWLLDVARQINSRLGRGPEGIMGE